MVSKSKLTMAVFLKGVLLVVMYSMVLSTELTPATSSTTYSSMLQSTKYPPKALPSNCSHWEAIRKKNLLYVDKSGFLKKLLLNEKRYWVVHRPRRFGKSTFLDMAYHFFSGDEHLFHDLEIDQDGNTKLLGINHELKWIRFPTIKIDFSLFEFETEDDFIAEFNLNMKEIAQEHGIDEKLVDGIDSLVDEMYLKYDRLKVMILIDEYDAPVNRALHRMKVDTALGLLYFINQILTIFKNHENIKFAYITGISKLSLIEFESGASDFRDISYDNILSEAFGFTKNEILLYMRPHLSEFARKIYGEDDKALETVINDLEYWYDGYRFDIKNNTAVKVYNPISTIESLSEKKFSAYWCDTFSSEKFANIFHEDSNQWSILDFKRNTGYKVPKIAIEKNIIISSQHLSVELPLWMFVRGYLTVTNYNENEGEFTLEYPNHEIENYVVNDIGDVPPTKQTDNN